MATNQEIVMFLRGRGWTTSNAEKIAEDLVDGKFVEADISTPERYAQAAQAWVGSEDAYKYASGWSTASWQHVLQDALEDPEFSLEHNIEGLRNVFLATVILAKKAGVEL